MFLSQHDHIAFVWRGYVDDHSNRSRLARAVRSEQAEDGTLPYRKRQVSDGHELIEAFGDALELYDIHQMPSACEKRFKLCVIRKQHGAGPFPLVLLGLSATYSRPPVS